MVATHLFQMFTPNLGEDVQFDDHIFQRGWFNHQAVHESPPSDPWRYSLMGRLCFHNIQMHSKSTPPKTNMSPQKGTTSIGNTSSNHSIFRGHVSFPVFQGVSRSSQYNGVYRCISKLCILQTPPLKCLEIFRPRWPCGYHCTLQASSQQCRLSTCQLAHCWARWTLCRMAGGNLSPELLAGLRCGRHLSSLTPGATHSQRLARI